MNDELDLDLDNLEAQTDKKLKVKNRFQELSEKVILTSKERDEKAKLAEQLQVQNSDLSKERDFYKDFSTNVARYPAASEYQDKILEKVRGGYSTEDAIVAVLNKEGKLNATHTAPTSIPTTTVEGGSAPTQITSGQKDIRDMSLDEKRAALLEAEKSGDLVRALRG